MWSGVQKSSAALLFARQKSTLTLPLARSLNLLGNEHVSVLENGVKVVSNSIPAHFCTVGAYVEAGSRFEDAKNSGTSHILDRIAFKSTKTRSVDKMLSNLERLGGNFMCSSSRELFVYQASVFEQDLELMTDLIADTIRNPLLTERELEETKLAASYEIGEIWSKPDHILPELAHVAAFRGNTLGNPLICPEENLSKIDRSIVEKYRKNLFRPDRMAIAFAGISHEEAVDLASKYFGSIRKSTSAFPKQPAVYTGGIIEIPSEMAAPLQPRHQQFTHLILAFESLPISDPDVFAAATLQCILGGGGSFSAGGPGKGMYSRLYTNVLNQYGFMESCVAFNHFYSDSGLFGISASCDHQSAHKIAVIVCQELVRLLNPSYGYAITEIEATRAKNLLKSSLMYNLESKFVLVEDLARQALSNQYMSAQQICSKIDAITIDDLYRVAARILTGNVGNSPLSSRKPTVVVQGETKKVGNVFNMCDVYLK